MCDLYEIILIIIIIIIISLGQILLLYIANISRTRAHTHTPPFRLLLAVNDRSLLHSNKHSKVLGVFRV